MDFTDDVPAPPSPEPNDWRPLLDQALLRLADRDREPVLLCDVLGHSRTVAATALGIPEGTLSSRLARAREKLRQHLVRLGVTPALAITAWVGDSLSAIVPNLLLETTLASVPRPPASHLAEGILRTMFFTKLMKWTVFLGCLGAAIGLGWQVVPTVGADPEKPRTKTTEPTPTDEDRIQGTWFVERVATNGKDSPANDHPWLDARLSFVGNRVDFAYLPGRPKTFTLDPMMSPKHITFVLNNIAGTTTDANPHRLPSIYKLDGGKLYLTLGIMDFEERPTSFDWVNTKPPYIHLVLRRPTKEEQKTLAEEHERLLQGTWITVVEEHNGQREILLDRETLLQEKVPATLIPTLPRMIVENDTVKLFPDRRSQSPLTFTFKVDATVAPRHLTFTAMEALAEAKIKKGQVLNAIYDYSRGILRVTFSGPPGDVRPTTFDTKGTKNATLYMIKADEPLKLLGALKELTAPTPSLLGSWALAAKEIDGQRSEVKEVLPPRMLIHDQGVMFYRSFLEPLVFSYRVEGNKIDLRVAGQYRETTDDGRHRVFLPNQLMPGLFELKDAELRLTLASRPDGERPAALDSKKTGHEVLVFRREPADATSIRDKAWQVVEGEIDPAAVPPVKSRFVTTFSIEQFDHNAGFNQGALHFDGARLRLKSTMVAYVIRNHGKAKEIDLVLLGSGNLGTQGSVIKGIYQLQGNELVLCFPRLGTAGERPTSFEVKKTLNLKVTLKHTPPSPPVKVEPPKPTRVDELRKEFAKTLNRLRDRLVQGVEKGAIPLAELASIEPHVHEATLASATTLDEKIAVCERSIQRMKDVEKKNTAKPLKEQLSEIELLNLQARRLKVEIELEEFKQQQGNARPTMPKGN